jgi:TIR domain-containing protein/conflict system pore-forming effector with SLATT domain
METETAKAAPILNIAWTRFAQLDASSKRATSMHRSIRWWIIILGVLATLFAILSIMFPRANAGVVRPDYLDGFCNAVGICNTIGLSVRISLVTIPILASALAVIATKGLSNGDWLITRAGAEEIQKEIYFYRTILQKKKSRRDYLETRLNKILRQVNHGLKREFVYRPYKGRIPPNYSADDPSSDSGFDDITGEEYFRYRLENQLAWHNKKLNQYKAERFRTQLYIVIFGAAGTLLAAFDRTTIWVALTASLTAALAGWQELRNLDALIKNYSKVAVELTILHDHWLNLETEERTDAEFYRMVGGCENVLWAQNAEYIKSMQETLERFDLEEEASLINRVIKESVETDARMKEEMRDSVVELTHDTLLDAEETFYETFKDALGSLAEEASSEIVQMELEAMRQAAVEMAENVMEKAEQVAFTAYHPKEGRVLVWHPLLVYIHTLSAFDDVQQDVSLFKIQDPKEITRTSTTLLSRGTEMTVMPSCEGITFNPERITVKWIEDYQRVEFRFLAEQSLLDDAAKGHIDFFVGPLIVGSLKFVMLFNDKEMPHPLDSGPQAKMYGKDDVFISYSRKDKEVARAFKNILKATGLDVFLDVDDISTGQYWQDELMRRIERAKIFQIFWSSNYSASEVCRLEWEYALKQNKEEGYIRPVFWKDPLSPRPPDELNKFNFKYVELNLPEK